MLLLSLNLGLAARFRRARPTIGGAPGDFKPRNQEPAGGGGPAMPGGAAIVMAARMPRSSAVGVGGQPATATSTGITLPTRPRLAQLPPKTPPVQPQSTTATTISG